MARPRDDVAVRLLPVLAQRRGREGRRAAADLHLPLREPRSRTLEAQTAEKPFLRAGQKRAGRATSPRSCTARRRPSGSRRPRPRSSAAATCTGSARPRWRRRCARPARRAVEPDAAARHRRPAGGRPAWPRARARRGARSPRAAPTSTTSGSRTPSWCRPPRDLIGRQLARAAPGQEELRGRRGRRERATPL